jgi:hypothetical protein
LRDEGWLAKVATVQRFNDFGAFRVTSRRIFSSTSVKARSEFSLARRPVTPKHSVGGSLGEGGNDEESKKAKTTKGKFQKS